MNETILSISEYDDDVLKVLNLSRRLSPLKCENLFPRKWKAYEVFISFSAYSKFLFRIFFKGNKRELFWLRDYEFLAFRTKLFYLSLKSSELSENNTKIYQLQCSTEEAIKSDNVENSLIQNYILDISYKFHVCF